MNNIGTYLNDIDFLPPKNWDLTNFQDNQDEDLYSDSSSEYVGSVDGARTWDMLSDSSLGASYNPNPMDYYMFTDPGANEVNRISPAESKINQGWIDVPTDSKTYSKKDISRRVSPIQSGDVSTFLAKDPFPSNGDDASPSDFFNLWKIADGQIIDTDIEEY